MSASQHKQKIMIVDDAPSNIAVLGQILTGEYDLVVATNGEKALLLAEITPLPDLILLDIMMPGIDGYEVCARLKANSLTRRIPVIFVTAKDDTTDEEKGFACGGVDYLTKPVSAPIVRARVKTHLALHDQNRVLEKKVRERTVELSDTQDIFIFGLANLAECRDNETGGHIQRTQHYVRILAEQLAGHERYRNFLGPEVISLLFKSAPLHDIGKVGIPDSILLKPGKLTDEEFREMQRHVIYGYDCMVNSVKKLGKESLPSFLRFASEIALTHHEKWDGSGYPYGLKGEAIPVSGRLMTVADIYDALISKRPYKPPFTHSRAVEIITKGDGRVMPGHFDPDVLAAFQERQQEFREHALLYADFDEERQALEG